MKFDFIIGNPPYQEDVENKGDRANPIYDRFMNESFKMATVVELIHPARFLFNAGQTSKQWNVKMLNDPHFKVLYYEPDASKVFPGTDIKGGVAITLRNAKESFGAIGTFTSHEQLNGIVQKVERKEEGNLRLDSIIASQGLFKFSDLLFQSHPDVVQVLGKGTGNKIVSKVMERMPDVFLDAPPHKWGYVKLLGRIHGQREYKYIQRTFLIENPYIDGYKLFIPEANNKGTFGETLTEPSIGYPDEGASDTYLSAGPFSSEEEARNLSFYMKTKFFRALLGVRKVTQHCPPAVWALIPLLDFTGSSDVDWSLSISEIDRQLYARYDLEESEIEFIETHVKEMC